MKVFTLIMNLFTMLVLSFSYPSLISALEDNLYLVDQNIAEDVITLAAINTITVGPNYTIDGADVTMVAGSQIVLRPDFRVRVGSNFRASLGHMNGYTVNGIEQWEEGMYIHGNLDIQPSGFLTLLPGCEVVFIADKYGTITILGKFTVNGGVLKGNSSTPGSWKGIIVEGSGNCSLKGTAIEFAEQGVLVKSGARVVIEECTFKSNLIGVHMCGGAPVVRNSYFINNEWYGIKEDAGGRPQEIQDNIFSGNSHNYYHEGLGIISIPHLNTLYGSWGNVER